MPRSQKMPDKPIDRRRERGAKSRAAILTEAMAMASLEGLEGLTLGRLADKLGVGKANIMVLFGNKENLQLATLDAAADLFVAQIVTPALARKTPIERLRSLCDGWFDYVARGVLPGGCLMYATAFEYRNQSGTLRDKALYYRARWQGLLVTTIEEAQRAGELDPALDRRQMAFDITAFQGAANAATPSGDRPTFLRARRSVRQRIDMARVDGA